MGSLPDGLPNNRVHGNAGGLTSHLTKQKELGTPATVGIGTKLTKKWDLKLRNWAQTKEVYRETTREFHERLEAPPLLSGTAATGSNKEKHQLEDKKSEF